MSVRVPKPGARCLASANPTGVPSSSSATNAISEAMISRTSASSFSLVGRPLVGRRRDLVIECPPELGDGVEILGDGAANDHPAILAAVSRYCADRFWNGAKRSPLARTSGIDSERPSA